MSQFDDMVKFLDSAWPAKDMIVPCLVGPAGIGKTAAVYQHASNVGAGKVVTIIASQILPNEVSGITMPDAESRSMEIYDHFRLSNLDDGDILFFDELLEADQLVLSACLTLIESRQMMSGKLLPDVQIIAATNPTIKPSMLKENIRQRFVWKTFESIDCDGLRNYIKKSYGFDIGNLVSYVQVTGSEYNILSPRTMTKMAAWISSAANNTERQMIATNIDGVFGNLIGSELLKAYNGSDNHKIRVALEAAAHQCNLDESIIEQIPDENITIDEMMQLLMSLPDWNKMEEILSNMPADEDINISF